MKLLSTSLFLLLSCYLSGQTIFVKSNALGLNDGSSWVNAFVSLDAALSVAAPGTEIWVSAGTYKP
ncbi:MAG: hypothetical protein Q7T20_02205, partial [Saprospiraceae bacterium]|nr:hypothetical protein [Saprospiraceae bacterium]